MESMLESLTLTSFLYFSFDHDEVLVLWYSQVVSTSHTAFGFLMLVFFLWGGGDVLNQSELLILICLSTNHCF